MGVCNKLSSGGAEVKKCRSCNHTFSAVTWEDRSGNIFSTLVARWAVREVCTQHAIFQDTKIQHTVNRLTETGSLEVHWSGLVIDLT